MFLLYPYWIVFIFCVARDSQSITSIKHQTSAEYACGNFLEKLSDGAYSRSYLSTIYAICRQGTRQDAVKITTWRRQPEKNLLNVELTFITLLKDLTFTGSNSVEHVVDIQWIKSDFVYVLYASRLMVLNGSDSFKEVNILRKLNNVYTTSPLVLARGLTSRNNILIVCQSSDHSYLTLYEINDLNTSDIRLRSPDVRTLTMGIINDCAIPLNQEGIKQFFCVSNHGVYRIQMVNSSSYIIDGIALINPEYGREGVLSGDISSIALAAFTTALIVVINNDNSITVINLEDSQPKIQYHSDAINLEDLMTIGIVWDSGNSTFIVGGGKGISFTQLYSADHGVYRIQMVNSSSYIIDAIALINPENGRERVLSGVISSIALAAFDTALIAVINNDNSINVINLKDSQPKIQYHSDATNLDDLMTIGIVWGNGNSTFIVGGGKGISFIQLDSADVYPNTARLCEYNFTQGSSTYQTTPQCACYKGYATCLTEPPEPPEITIGEPTLISTTPISPNTLVTTKTRLVISHFVVAFAVLTLSLTINECNRCHRRQKEQTRLVKHVGDAKTMRKEVLNLAALSSGAGDNFNDVEEMAVQKVSGQDEEAIEKRRTLMKSRDWASMPVKGSKSEDNIDAMDPELYRRMFGVQVINLASSVTTKHPAVWRCIHRPFRKSKNLKRVFMYEIGTPSQDFKREYQYDQESDINDDDIQEFAERYISCYRELEGDLTLIHTFKTIEELFKNVANPPTAESKADINVIRRSVQNKCKTHAQFAAVEKRIIKRMQTSIPKQDMQKADSIDRRGSRKLSFKPTDGLPSTFPSDPPAADISSSEKRTPDLRKASTKTGKAYTRKQSYPVPAISGNKVPPTKPTASRATSRAPAKNAPSAAVPTKSYRKAARAASSRASKFPAIRKPK